jgi:hypothetical protein
MNTFRKMTLILAFLALFAIPAFGQDSSEREGRRGHQGPPPEAYTACEGKSVGDEAEFVSPQGDTVTGTCEEEGDRLVLRPDNPPPRRGGENGRMENTDS